MYGVIPAMLGRWMRQGVNGGGRLLQMENAVGGWEQLFPAGGEVPVAETGERVYPVCIRLLKEKHYAN